VVELVGLEPDLLGEVLALEVDHLLDGEVARVQPHLHAHAVGVVAVAEEGEPVVRQQELVRPVPVAVERLLTRLKRAPVQISEDEVSFFLQLLRIIPVELLFGLIAALRIFRHILHRHRFKFVLFNELLSILIPVEVELFNLFEFTINR